MMDWPGWLSRTTVAAPPASMRSRRSVTSGARSPRGLPAARLGTIALSVGAAASLTVPPISTVAPPAGAKKSKPLGVP